MTTNFPIHVLTNKFCILVEPKEQEEVVSIVKIQAPQQFSWLVWFVESCSRSTVTMSRGGRSLSSTKISAVRVLLCNVTKSLKEAVVDHTWVQLSIAT